MTCGNINTMTLDGLRAAAKALGIKDMTRTRSTGRNTGGAEKGIGQGKRQLQNAIIKELVKLKVPKAGNAKYPYSRSSDLVKKK